MKHKFIVFDMDGVIFKKDSFWSELGKELGNWEIGEELTRKYLKTDTKKLADEVIGKLWKGKSADAFFKLIRKSEYNAGVKETIKELRDRNFKICILTTGPIELAKRAKTELKIDFIYGNEIVIKDNVITGDYNWLFLDFNHKGEFLKKICNEHNFKLEETIVVGDNEQDIHKFKVAGLSIAFNSISEELKQEADVVVDGDDLREILRYI